MISFDANIINVEFFIWKIEELDKLILVWVARTKFGPLSLLNFHTNLERFR
jgi:hypothetical protein